MEAAAPEEVAVGLMRGAALAADAQLFNEVVWILLLRAQVVVLLAAPMVLLAVSPLEAQELVALLRRRELVERKWPVEPQGQDQEVPRVLFTPEVMQERLLRLAAVAVVRAIMAAAPAEATRVARAQARAVDQAQASSRPVALAMADLQ